MLTAMGTASAGIRSSPAATSPNAPPLAEEETFALPAKLLGGFDVASGYSIVLAVPPENPRDEEASGEEDREAQRPQAAHRAGDAQDVASARDRLKGRIGVNNRAIGRDKRDAIRQTIKYFPERLIVGFGVSQAR